MGNTMSTDGKLQNVSVSADQILRGTLAVYSQMPGADTSGDTEPSFRDFIHAYAQQVSKEQGRPYDKDKVEAFVNDLARAYHMDPDSPMGTDYRTRAQKFGGGETLQRMAGAAYAYHAIFLDKTIDSVHDIQNDPDHRALRDTAIGSGKRLEMMSGLLDPLLDGPLTRGQLVRKLENTQQDWDKMPGPHKSYPGLVALQQELARSFNDAGGAKTIDPRNKSQMTETVQWLADANHIKLTDQELNTVVQRFSNNYLPLPGSEMVLQPGKPKPASVSQN